LTALARSLTSTDAISSGRAAHHDLMIHNPDGSVMENASDTIFGYARLFDAPGQAVIATDVSGEILYWSSAAALLYGWQEEEVLGVNVVDVTPADEMRENAEEIMARLREGRSWSGEFTVRRRDGSRVVVDVRDLPVRNSIGELIGVVGVSAPTADLPV
jgi:PAS domain S-box-containing protein